MSKKEQRRQSEPHSGRSRHPAEKTRVNVAPSDDETSLSENSKPPSETTLLSNLSPNTSPPRKLDSEETKLTKKIVPHSNSVPRGYIAIGQNRTPSSDTSQNTMNDRQPQHHSPTTTSHESTIQSPSVPSRHSPHSVRGPSSNSSSTTTSSNPSSLSSPTQSPSVSRRTAEKMSPTGPKIKIETHSKSPHSSSKPLQNPTSHLESSTTTFVTTVTNHSPPVTRSVQVSSVQSSHSRPTMSTNTVPSSKDVQTSPTISDRTTTTTTTTTHNVTSGPTSQDQSSTVSSTSTSTSTSASTEPRVGRQKSNSNTQSTLSSSGHTTKSRPVNPSEKTHTNPSDHSNTHNVPDSSTESVSESPSLSPTQSPPDSPRESAFRSSEYPKKTKLSLKDFKILKLIGKGGYGEVYLVEHKKNKKKLALKIMEKELIFKRNKVQHIKNERNVLVKGKVNPHLVRLHYSFQDRQYLYLAMEYCPGGDLRSLLNAIGTLEEEDAKLYFAEMISSVKYLHSLGYIHRDLKPENFLIDRFGHLKLADFGLSKEGVLSPDSYRDAPQLRRRESLISVKSIEALNAQNFDQRFVRTRSPSLSKKQLPAFNASSSLSKSSILTRKQQAYSIVGSPDYMSPEVLRQEGYGEEVDWWSLGIIFFEVLLGGCPFAGDTPEEVFQNISNWRRIIPALLQQSQPYLSPACYDLLSGLLSAPEKRMAFLKGPNGTDKLRTHPFFAGLDWDDLRKHTPPFIPKLSGDTDTSYFNVENIEGVNAKIDSDSEYETNNTNQS